jgi:hypothetical protein
VTGASSKRGDTTYPAFLALLSRRSESTSLDSSVFSKCTEMISGGSRSALTTTDPPTRVHSANTSRTVTLFAMSVT